jgi:histidinol-phosphate aminotransferase
MSKYWNQRTRRLQPYIPGEQPQDQRYIKLNTNENPAPPSAAVLDAMHAAVEDGLNLYPDPESCELKQSIANYYSLSAGNVFVGNGSDEVLAHIFAGLFDSDKPLLCPDITYSFYPAYARLYDIKLQKIPLGEYFELDLKAYPAENGGVIFANPNAPTSLAIGLDEIEAFLLRNIDSVVVVDEAYVDFGAQSCAQLVSAYPNLLVVQTVSKSRSLAGLRVGFALGDFQLINGLERVKNSFNSYPLDKVAQAGAQAAFEDVQGFEIARENVIRIRDQAARHMRELGFEVLESQANFLLVRPSFLSAEEVYLGLRGAGVLVRYFNAPRICDYLRITVGTEQDMAVLVEKLILLREASADS